MIAKVLAGKSADTQLMSSTGKSVINKLAQELWYHYSWVRSKEAGQVIE